MANATKDADAMRNKLNGMARDINEIKADLAEASKADSTNWLRKPIPDAGDDVLNKYANGGGGARLGK